MKTFKKSLTHKECLDLISDPRIDLTENESSLLKQMLHLHQALKLYEYDKDEYEKPESEKSHAKEILAANPAKTGHHTLYEMAWTLVSERHSKFELIHLVNWLLFKLAGHGFTLTESEKICKAKNALEIAIRACKKHGFPLEFIQDLELSLQELQNPITRIGLEAIPIKIS